MEYKKRHAFEEAMLDRMERDGWDGYSKSEYHEAITMKATEKKKKKKKKKAEKNSMKEIEADIHRELERKEQEREQELITHYPSTILESGVGEHGYVEYRVILEELILPNIEYKLQKTTDEQPPMNSRETKKFKKCPKQETEAYQEKFRKATGGDDEDAL